MTDVLLFGGTTEGRVLAQALQKKNIPAVVCVATAYGESLLTAGGSLRVLGGGLDRAAMAALMGRERPRLVLDATHPYADQVSRDIRSACAETGCAYGRVGREEDIPEGCRVFPDLAALTAYLDECPGMIFSALGSKEAQALAGIRDAANRVWLRILPSVRGLEGCLAAGFPARHIICMQGPFSAALNEAMFRAAGADVLVTKASGAAGGFAEKVEAARRCGMTVAVLARPRDADGLPLADWLGRIEEGNL